MEKSLPWTEGHFPAESSLARSVYVNKPRADNSASACSLSYPKKSENVRSHSSNSIENATPSSGTSPLASYKEEPSPAGALGTCCCFRRLKIAWNSLHILLCSLVLKSWLRGPCTTLWMEMQILLSTPTENYYQPNTYWSQVQQICWSHVSCSLRSWPPLLSVWCPNERHLFNTTLNKTIMALLKHF